MTIDQLIVLARNGELKNIASDDTNAIVTYINLGLIELYKRFPLMVEEYVLELHDGSNIYTMPSDYMWLVAAYGEVDADSDAAVSILQINAEDDPMSINTISYNQVQVPISLDNEYISLIYVASPAYIMYDSDTGTYSYTDKYGVTNTIIDVPIPPQMIEAILHYIGYRAHGAMNGNVQAENNTHYQRFEASCKRIVDLGLYTSDDLNMTSRNLKGFV